MPPLRLVALVSIGVIIGLGTGLGAGYTMFTPQVGVLQEKLDAAESKLVAVEAKYNEVISGKERADVLVQDSLKERDAKIKSLEAEIQSKNSELLSLKEIKIESEKILAQRAAIEKELEDARNQLVSLKSADVRLVAFDIKTIEKDGPDEHIITGYLVNFGNGDAKSARLEIQWQGPGGCPCAPEIVRKEAIQFTDIKARSVIVINQSYSIDGMPIWFFEWQK